MAEAQTDFSKAVFSAEKEHAAPPRQQAELRPAAHSKLVPIVFCADANYGTYLPVVLQSIIENSSLSYHYHIIILDCGITENAVAAMAAQLALHKNFSYEIKDVRHFLKKYQQNFRERLHYTRAMYGRLFIPELCRIYERVIYTDIDVVFERDIAELMEIDLGDSYIAAVTELAVEFERLADKKIARYIGEELYLDKTMPCIYSGLLVFNVKLWRDNGITEKIIAFLAGRKLRCPDQDAIASLCRGKITYLGQDWTCIILKERVERFAGRVDKARYPKQAALLAEWRAACVSGKAVIHYNGPLKPWHSLHVFLGEKWWRYARKTAFYPHYNHLLIQDMARQDLPLKIYRILGIPFWRIKTTPHEKKYLLGNYRIAKKEYKGNHGFIYILGIKLFSVGAD